jgi:glycine betaine/choline ABC-type transport system substrate-binding protein
MPGLYRYRVGDLFTVSGFYNATPLFHYSGRHDVALSIDYETISEQDLLKAISQAYELHLRPLGYVFAGSTIPVNGQVTAVHRVSTRGRIGQTQIRYLSVSILSLSGRPSARYHPTSGQLIS